MIKGNKIKLTTNKANENQCSDSLLYVDYENIVKIVKKGNKIYIDDGLISLVVLSTGKLNEIINIIMYEILNFNFFKKRVIQSSAQLKTEVYWEARRELTFQVYQLIYQQSLRRIDLIYFLVLSKE